MADLSLWISVFAASLLGYAIVHRRDFRKGGLRWLIFYSIANATAIVIISAPIQWLIDNPRSLAWWLVLLSIVGVALLSWLANRLITGRNYKDDNGSGRGGGSRS